MLPIAMMLANAVFAGSVKDLDKRNGFRDLKLGSTCSEVSGFATDGVPSRKLVSYVRPADILQVGEAQLQSIAYSCYLDQLTQVRVAVLGVRNHLSMLDALIEAYGEPLTTDETAGFHSWNGKKVLLEAFTAPNTDTMVVVLTSQPLLQKRLKDVVDAKAAAVEDL